MKIGIPKEVLNNENRIALTPSGVLTLKNAGHQIFVETGAGLGSSFSDKEYENAGAKIVSTAKEAWSQELVLKVKEPQVEEYDYLRDGLQIFTYLHLAAEEKLTKQLIDKKVTSLAYETVQLDDGSLPLLTPMSEVAGYMAAQIGAQFLEKSHGGKGVLLAGIPGVKRAKVTIIGGGVVGTNAAKIAVGLGASVTVLDLSSKRLKELDELFGSKINTLISNPMNISEEVAQSDLVIGAVLIPGSKAPKLVTEEMVKRMSPGSVIVDVAIDQGGIFATSDRVTTHDNPIYKKHGVSHYAVANMPGAVPRTSTIGLANATVPYVLEIAEKGLKQAMLDNKALRRGMNTIAGNVTNKSVADAHNLPYEHVEDILSRI